MILSISKNAHFKRGHLRGASEGVEEPVARVLRGDHARAELQREVRHLCAFAIAASSFQSTFCDIYFFRENEEKNYILSIKFSKFAKMLQFVANVCPYGGSAQF